MNFNVRVKVRVDASVDGQRDGQMNGRKTGSLYGAMLKAGTTKMIIHVQQVGRRMVCNFL